MPLLRGSHINPHSLLRRAISMRFSKILQRAFCAALLCAGIASVISAPAALHAQSTTEGAIAGTVTDPTGAIISSAAVTLHNNDTNAEIKLASDSSGYFKAPLVTP